jgi:WD40 repeat protein
MTLRSSGLAALALLLISCSAHRPSNPRSLDARLALARADAAMDSRQWGLAAGYFAAARVSEDSSAARWGLGQATGRASTQTWTRRIEGSVLALAFSPEGRLLASAGMDSRIRLWNARSGELLQEFTGHTAEVHAVAFSPDGQWLASAGRPGEIRLWSVSQGRQVAVIEGHTDVVRGLAFSPDGRWLASCGLDKTVRVWDVGTGTELMRFAHEDYAIAVVFSPEGRRLLSTSMDRTARVWDLETRREVLRLLGHEEKVESAAFSADGQRILTAAADDALRFWDARSGQLVDVLRTEHISAAAIDPRFQLLVQAGWDGRVRLFDPHWGVLLERMDAHASFVMSVALSPDGRTFASGGHDGVLSVGARPEAPREEVLRGHAGWVEALAFTGEQRLISGGEEGLRAWDLAAGPSVEPSPFGAGAVTLALHPQGQLLAAGTTTGTVRLTDVASGRVLQELSGVTGSVRALAFSPEGALLAAGGDRDILLWSLPSGALVGRLQGHTEKVWSLVFSPSGHRLASGGADKTLRLWDVERLRQVHQRDVGGTVRALVFTPSGEQLVTAGMKQPLQLWDAEELRPLRVLEDNPVGVLALALSRDGAFLASSGLDLTVKVWSLPSGDLLGRLRGHQGVATALTFSPGMSSLAWAGADRTVRRVRLEELANPPPAEKDFPDTLRRYGFTWDAERLLLQRR